MEHKMSYECDTESFSDSVTETTEDFLDTLFDFKNGYAERASMYLPKDNLDRRCFLLMTSCQIRNMSRYFYFFRNYMISTFDNVVFDVKEHTLTLHELFIIKLSQLGVYDEITKLERICDVRPDRVRPDCVRPKRDMFEHQKKEIETEQALLLFDKKRLKIERAKLESDRLELIKYQEHLDSLNILNV